MTSGQKETERAPCKCDINPVVFILAGADYTLFKGESDYKLTFMWCLVSAYKVTITISILLALLLLLAASLLGDTAFTLLQIVPWFGATMVVLCLIIGLCRHQPNYFFPFRVFCAVGRIVCLLSLALFVPFGILVSVLDFIEHPNDQTIIAYRSWTITNICSGRSGAIRNSFLCIVFCNLLYIVLGFCANAVSRCAYYFKEKK